MYRSIATIFCITLCISLAVGASRGLRPSVLRSDTSLMNFMVKTQAYQSTAPQRSVQCFNYYTPLLNQMSVDYERNYNDCLDLAANAHEAINNGTLAQRNALKNTAQSSCLAVSHCSTLYDAVESYECYQSVSSNNTKDFYSISSTAGDELLELHEQMRLIDLSMYRCTNASEHAYVQNTAQTYEELQRCLMGISPVPTTELPTEAPTTQPPTTQPPTTAAPTTSVPSTQAPTTLPPTYATAAPTTLPPTYATAAPTTQAPTTRAPTTQAPTTQAPTTRAPTTTTVAPVTTTTTGY